MSLLGSAAAAGSASDANTSKTATEDFFIAPTPLKSSFLVCRPRATRGPVSDCGKLCSDLGKILKGPNLDRLEASFVAGTRRRSTESGRSIEKRKADAVLLLFFCAAVRFLRSVISRGNSLYPHPWLPRTS